MLRRKGDIRYKTFSEKEGSLEKEKNITTKSTKDTKGNKIEKNFVIFVYFVVDEIYNVSLALELQDCRKQL